VLRRWLPVTHVYHGQHFIFREEHVRWVATPLLVVLLMVESTDVLFALDSIPAIFAVTRDPFIVYTSNIFAILGLRALYFLLANVIERFHFLRFGLAVVLTYIGVKMIITMFDIHINTLFSLGVVAFVLAASVVLSLLFPKEALEHAPVVHDPLNPNHVIGEEKKDADGE
jgi:tellurite resistance protein TerC